MARGLETRCIPSHVCFFSFFLFFLNITNDILLTDRHHHHLNIQPREQQGMRASDASRVVSVFDVIESTATTHVKTLDVVDNAHEVSYTLFPFFPLLFFFFY
jgi:hypothetical protein